MLHFFTYRFPFNRPFYTARRRFTFREGVIMRLIKNGITALGEAAPLPGFSNEGRTGICIQLKKRKKEILDFFETDFTLREVERFLTDEPFSPSLNFGLYTLAATYLARQSSSSLHHFLFENPREDVAVNAVLGLEHTRPHPEVDYLVNKGFSTLKVKANENWTHFEKVLQYLATNYPDLTIRIDANQSWSPEQAVTYLRRMESWKVEYCEEPLSQPDEDSLRNLQRHTTTPVALDESLSNIFTPYEAVKLAPVLVLKPMVLGITPVLNTGLGQAKCIYTSSLESGIGRLMTASLAAGRGAEAAHGLATGARLKVDIWNDTPFLQNGRYILPDAGRLNRLMDTDLSSLPLRPLDE